MVGTARYHMYEQVVDVSKIYCLVQEKSCSEDLDNLEAHNFSPFRESYHTNSKQKPDSLTMFRLNLRTLVASLVATSCLSLADALDWVWSYSGSSISASGTLETTETPDGEGFYTVVSIRSEERRVGKECC